MRSIRRSMTGYLLVLLALTLAVVWVVIDQVTARSLRDRQRAAADAIELRFKERCREEVARTDEALLAQARQLGLIVQSYFVTDSSTEWVKSGAAMSSVQLAFSPAPFSASPLSQSLWVRLGNYQAAWGEPPHPSPWIVWGRYFANPPLPDEVILHLLGEKEGKDFLQINTQSGRKWHSASLGGRDLPFDAILLEGSMRATGTDSPSEESGKPGEGSASREWVVGKVLTSDGKEPVRRVLLSMPYYPRTSPPIRGRRGPAPGPPPRSVLGSWAAWSLAGLGSPPSSGAPGPPSVLPSPPPSLESLPRLYIQCARPQALIDHALAQFANDRDEEHARLASDIQWARGTMRVQVAVLGMIAFLAVAIGGPWLVGRALRPVGKLSDAVSRVSERDFKLPHDGTDLSEELEPIHARLNQTLDLLRRAFSREKQAVADISHELRTPIAALMATIDVALRKPRTPDQYRETLEECRLISRQLSQLVERIMTLASLDAGNDHTQLSRVDAAEIVCGCAAVIRPLAQANSIKVDLHAEEPIELETDAGKLREVLMNLLHNAIEYNKPNGSISLTARRENGSAVFEVRDTGIGMPPDVQEKIFERFYRADTS
ncbi:MAG TPA: HAMP domain-containing sensor histidine kinase, partial [Gemmata sp.]|nr:HAMP domain-containing sensor histidine kinase [Gemmata sp.]